MDIYSTKAYRRFLLFIRLKPLQKSPTKNWLKHFLPAAIFYGTRASSSGKSKTASTLFIDICQRYMKFSIQNGQSSIPKKKGKRLKPSIPSVQTSLLILV